MTHPALLELGKILARAMVRELLDEEKAEVNGKKMAAQSLRSHRKEHGDDSE